MDKLDFIKIRNFCCVKDTDKNEKTSQGLREVRANHRLTNGHAGHIHKEPENSEARRNQVRDLHSGSRGRVDGAEPAKVRQQNRDEARRTQHPRR